MADNSTEFGADGFEVILPVWAIYSIDALFLEMHDSVIKVHSHNVGCVNDKARSQVHNLVQIVAKEAIIVVSQSVMHLNSALRVTNVENFIFTRDILNCFNVCSIIIKTHVAPMEVPVFVILGRIESLVTPTVLGTTVVSHVDIVAGVN